MDLALPLTDCQTYFLFEFESEFGKISTHSMSIPSCTILENSENSDAPQLKQGWLTGTIHKKHLGCARVKVPLKVLWSVCICCSMQFL